jgi:hypothetical protein
MIAVAVSLATLPILQTANAAIISTDAAMDYVDRQDQIERINTALARDSVQKVLIEMGVDPEDASARVQLLTDAELQTLDQHLAELPAGGVGFLEVVGIVAIVLIVLELLNVTNFFSEF